MILILETCEGIASKVIAKARPQNGMTQNEEYDKDDTNHDLGNGEGISQTLDPVIIIKVGQECIAGECCLENVDEKGTTITQNNTALNAEIDVSDDERTLDQ